MNPDQYFDSVIGRLDRSISEILVLVDLHFRSAHLTDVDAQTLKHHAVDLIDVGEKILKRLKEGK